MMTIRWSGIAMALVIGCGGPAATDKKLPAGSATASDTMTVDSLVGLAPEVAASAPLPVAVTTPADTASTAATPDELASLAAGMIIPVQGVVASQLRDSYTEARSGHAHEALDIMAPRGTPVLSATDGRVLKLYQSVAGGTMVYAADASDRFILMYGHLDRYADGLTETMPIKRGQLIGYVGSTGNVPPGATHLHFAIARGHPSVAWWKGAAVNPYPLFVPPLAPDPAGVQTPFIAVPPSPKSRGIS
jgi:murein DD-endopeptidase MepM/ murein hydrolase activator NlpD